ncbi:Ig-like domain-containing protein [Haloplanus sp. GCM10025708]|uniref:Ig-like domain-containing protein n=1 Tax=Haloplanus sp. GCM10025708 TaxID=3252679 RepID=UPI00360C4324
MRLRADDRGQTVQVGVILLFGILVIGLSIYQATVVPQQNERVEYEAYQQATEDLLSLGNGVTTAATRDVVTGTNVQTGARYPSRTIFVNAPPPTGSIGTANAPNVTLRDVRAIGSEPRNVREFWSAVGANQQYEASRVRFSPNYNHFDASPVVLTGSGAYRSVDDTVVPLTSQTLVSGNRITVVTLRGDMSTAGYVTPVTATPVTASTRTVTITGDGEDFSITVPTPDDAAAWNERVGQSLVDGNPNVVSATPHGNGSATVTFDGLRQYELRLAAVELRTRSDSSVVASPGPAYLLGVTENETAFSGKPKTLVVEVRDRYNNPVTGAPVNFSVTAGSGTLSSSVASTDDEGAHASRSRPTATTRGTRPSKRGVTTTATGRTTPTRRRRSSWSFSTLATSRAVQTTSARISIRPARTICCSLVRAKPRKIG